MKVLSWIVLSNILSWCRLCRDLVLRWTWAPSWVVCLRWKRQPVHEALDYWTWILCFLLLLLMIVLTAAWALACKSAVWCFFIMQLCYRSTTACVRTTGLESSMALCHYKFVRCMLCTAIKWMCLFVIFLVPALSSQPNVISCDSNSIATFCSWAWKGKVLSDTCAIT
jgi:hypothetical protein